MNFFGITAIFVVICVELSWRSEACMCMPEHPQQKYCKANFVLKGVITDNGNVQGNNWNITEMVPRSAEKEFTTYYVQVEKIYKGQNGISPNSNGVVEIKTPQSASLCGNLELEKGRSYLLSGKNANGTLVIDICDWVVAYRVMTKKQRQSVRFFYKQNCRICEITPCYSKEQCTHQESIPNSCSYDMTHLLTGSTDCEGRHSRCIRSSDGKCRWARSSQMKECIKERTILEENSQL